MADRAVAEGSAPGALGELTTTEARSRGRLRLGRVPVGTQLNVRARPAPDEVAGVRLPATPNTLAVSGRVEALWLGPDEWLLLDRAGDPGLEDRVRAGLADRPAAVTDVSAARVLLEIAGPAARGLLAHGCAIDLHPASFAVGTCVQTRLALADVVLFAAESPDPPIHPDHKGHPHHESHPDHESDPVFRVLVRTSFAEYLATWLLDAAAEDLDPVGAAA